MEHEEEGMEHIAEIVERVLTEVVAPPAKKVPAGRGAEWDRHTRWDMRKARAVAQRFPGSFRTSFRAFAKVNGIQPNSPKLAQILRAS